MLIAKPFVKLINVQCSDKRTYSLQIWIYHKNGHLSGIRPILHSTLAFKDCCCITFG